MKIVTGFLYIYSKRRDLIVLRCVKASEISYTMRCNTLGVDNRDVTVIMATKARYKPKQLMTLYMVITFGSTI